MNGKATVYPPADDAPITCDEQAELDVLASLLIDPDFVEAEIGALTEGLFFHSQHKMIFRAMHAVWHAGEPVDHYSVASELARVGAMEYGEATVLLLGLAARVTSSIFGKSRIPTLTRLMFTRQTVRVTQEVLERGAQGASAAELYSFLRERTYELAPVGDSASKWWTAGELLRTAFAEPVWIVPGLIPSGFTVLAGRPKLGKSWLALQIATAVGAGGKVFDRDVEARRVLYLALEDNERRIKERLVKQKAPALETVDFRFEWPPLTSVLAVDELTKAIDSKEYGLVVIDTISRALGDADQQDQAAMNMRLGTLQRMAIERNIGFLVVDHHRKPTANVGDVVDDVMGATSKVGVADAALGLYRARGQSEATLKVTGRDVMDQEMILNWDVDLSCWQHGGDAATVRADTVQASIIEAMEELGGRATVPQVAQFLEQKPQHVRREMKELEKKGLLQTEGNSKNAGDGRKAKAVVYVLSGSGEAEE